MKVGLCSRSLGPRSRPELIARARDIHPGLPCLLITGYWDSDALAQYGLDCPILRKPFTNAALRDAMADAFGPG